MQNLTQKLKQMMTASEAKLTFGYSTLANRVQNISFPKVTQNREFLVIIQNPEHEIFKVQATNVKVIELSSKGVAKSRNEALRNASGDYLIFADDDIIFNEDGIRELINYFQNHPECSLIMAQTIDQQGQLRKNYPTRQLKLTRFNSAKAATYEMMVRVDAIRSKAVLFDEDFGAGVENFLGDEYIFITDALKKGLKGVFLPVTVAIHPTESSGSTWGTERDLVARARVFTRVFGITAPIFRALFLLKSSNGFIGWAKAVRFILGR